MNLHHLQSEWDDEAARARLLQRRAATPRIRIARSEAALLTAMIVGTAIIGALQGLV